jgi:hypothetical protein
MSRDTPLSLKWRADESLLDLPELKPRSELEAAAILGILGCCRIAQDVGRYVSYSRSRAWYLGRQRYLGAAGTYGIIIPATSRLVAAGLTGTWIAPQGTRGHLRSQLWLTPDGSQLVSRRPLRWVSHTEREILLLRNNDRQLIDYRDTRRTRQLRRTLKIVNGQISQIAIDITHPGVTKTEHHWAYDTTTTDGQVMINYVAVEPEPGLRRIFNRGSWELGGRAYASYQNLPKTIRARLTINGEAVASHDFPQLHPSMLYAMAGKQLHGDAYELPGCERQEGKLAFNMSVNAKTPREAVGAIGQHLAEMRGGRHPTRAERERATELYGAVLVRHPEIPEAFGSDMGLVLQRRDSDLILDTTMQCYEDGIPVLPVHDELIMPARFKAEVIEKMTRNLCLMLGSLNP